MDATRCEVVVVGGGPAGSAVALLLADAGHDVILIERTDGTGERVGETVNARAIAILDELGVGAEVRAQGHGVSHRLLTAWSSAHLDEKELADEDADFGEFWHLDRVRFDRLLLDASRQRGARVVMQSSVSRPRVQGKMVDIEIADREGPTRIVADFIVDATGRAASVARAMGAKRHHENGIPMVGLVANVKSDSGQFFTMTEAHPDGWWYTAWLPQGRHIGILLTDADRMPRGRRAIRHFFHERLRQSPHTAARLGPLPEAYLPKIVAAGCTYVDRCAGARWLAVGDAALSFDPMSGAGVWHALDSSRRAGYAVSATLAGDSRALDEYRTDQAETLGAYRPMIREIYLRNLRWPEAPFWQRRQRDPNIEVAPMGP